MCGSHSDSLPTVTPAGMLQVCITPGFVRIRKEPECKVTWDSPYAPTFCPFASVAYHSVELSCVQKTDFSKATWGLRDYISGLIAL
jgi:hypothetical protein